MCRLANNNKCNRYLLPKAATSVTDMCRAVETADTLPSKKNGIENWIVSRVLSADPNSKRDISPQSSLHCKRCFSGATGWEGLGTIGRTARVTQSRVDRDKVVLFYRCNVLSGSSQNVEVISSRLHSIKGYLPITLGCCL